MSLKTVLKVLGAISLFFGIAGLTFLALEKNIVLDSQQNYDFEESSETRHLHKHGDLKKLSLKKLEKQTHHACQHDTKLKEHYEWLNKEYKFIDYSEFPKEMTLEHERELINKHGQGKFADMRIYSKLVTANQIDAKSKNAIENDIMPAVLGYLKKALRVYPKQDLIKPFGNNGKCVDSLIPSEDQRNGVKADIAFYIYAQFMNDDTLAYASLCQLDRSANNRPIVGGITINTKFLQQHLKQGRWQEWVDTLIHEVMHALGFASNVMQKYWPTGNPLKVIRGQNWITSQKVVDYGKNYFNCPSLTGLPFEDEGGDGSAGSHWERTTFGNEAMTAADYPGPVFSQFTLLVFEASGWYFPNYDMSQDFTWGFQEGCSFVNKKCPDLSARERCQPNKELVCAFDYHGVTLCSNEDTFANGCYFKSGDSDKCQSTSGTGHQMGAAMDQGNGGGPSSRCWETNMPNKYFSPNGDISAFNAACLKSKCEKGVPSFQIKNTWVSCQSEGQVLKSSGGNWVKCPTSFLMFCNSESSCPNECNQRGNCRKGVCQCYEGFKGADCSQKI